MEAGSRSGNSPTSAPAENALPSPQRTSARLVRTSSPSKWAASARSTSVEIAFSFSGRRRVRTHTSPSRLVSTNSLTAGIVEFHALNTEVFITCAVTGAGATTERSELVPVTPAQIADAAIEAARAGAAIAHIHVRDPGACGPSRHTALYREVVALIP